MSRVERNQAIYRENEEYRRQLQEREEAPENQSKASLDQGQRRRGTDSRIMHTIGTVLLVVILAACMCLTIPKLAGYDAYVVVSGSMEPNIPVGSLVFSKKVDPAQLAVGDVIVYKSVRRDDTPITHRVVRNDSTNQMIITKGDANEREDAYPPTYDNVVGIVTLHVPRVGFVASMMTSVLGKIITGLVLIEAWLLMEIGRRPMKKA